MDSSSHPETQTSPRAALARWLVLIAVTFAVLAFAFTWISRSWTLSSPVEATAADGAGGGGQYPPPNFRLGSLDGRSMGPPDFVGQPVIVDFWATWCGPCKLQAEMLDKIHGELAARGVQFLAVNIGEDAETVKSYVANSPFPYPVLLDEREELMTRYQLYGLPTVMIIDRQGQISFMRTGVTDVPTLRRELGKVLDASQSV